LIFEDVRVRQDFFFEIDSFAHGVPEPEVGDRTDWLLDDPEFQGADCRGWELGREEEMVPGRDYGHVENGLVHVSGE
jgi:hypothetical protein